MRLVRGRKLTSILRFAAAYAITKALIPVRLLAAVYGAPWFARVAIAPLTNLIKRFWARTRWK